MITSFEKFKISKQFWSKTYHKNAKRKPGIPPHVTAKFRDWCLLALPIRKGSETTPSKVVTKFNRKVQGVPQLQAAANP